MRTNGESTANENDAMFASSSTATPTYICTSRYSHARGSRRSTGRITRQIGDATQRANALVQAVVETHQKAQEAGRIAVLGATGVAQTNASLQKMLVELRNELHQIRTKIEGAEERANTTQRIADSAEQRANDAQNVADAAEQHAVAAQSNADAAQANQELLEQELQNADLAF